MDNKWKDGCTDILNEAHFHGPCNFMSGSKVKTAIVLASMAAFHEKRHKT